MYVMELQELTAGLILVASICAGFCAVYIARSKSSVNKHSRQRIKDFESDIKYLAESKKQEAKDYRMEILRLKGTINKMKQGPDFTEKELIDGSGIGDLLLTKFGLGKYRKFLQPYLPQIEKAIIENKDEIINTIKFKSNNQQAQPGTEAQGIQTL
jgi:hypothetical protein